MLTKIGETVTWEAYMQIENVIVGARSNMLIIEGYSVEIVLKNLSHQPRQNILLSGLEKHQKDLGPTGKHLYF